METRRLCLLPRIVAQVVGQWIESSAALHTIGSVALMFISRKVEDDKPVWLLDWAVIRFSETVHKSRSVMDEWHVTKRFFAVNAA